MKPSRSCACRSDGLEAVNAAVDRLTSNCRTAVSPPFMSSFTKRPFRVNSISGNAANDSAPLNGTCLAAGCPGNRGP